jgi:hypothetical protein
MKFLNTLLEKTNPYKLEDLKYMKTYSLSTRDASNVECDIHKDNRIVLYETITPDEVYVTYVCCLHQTGSYIVSVADDTGNIYSYKNRDLYEDFKTWNEAYKFITKILKVIGFTEKLEILTP